MSSNQYPLILPLLFLNFDTSIKSPFQSEVLAKVQIIFSICTLNANHCLEQFIKIVLFGAKSVTGASGKTRPTKGILWGVEKTTPGMVAAAATLVSIDSTLLLLC